MVHMSPPYNRYKRVYYLMSGSKQHLEQRKVVYEKAKAKTERITQEGIRHHLTMQLKKGKLALRLVRRGEERFSDVRIQTRDR